MKSFGDMVKQAQKMQKQMAELQEKLAEERFEATRGRRDGARRSSTASRCCKEIKISPEALKDGDITLLEDLIITAVGEAQRASETHMKETLGKLTGGIDASLLSSAPPTPHVQLEVPGASRSRS